MALLVRLYRLINILSIDVATGAVVSALFFASIFDVTITPYGLIALGLSVWIIYTADHLRDARKIKTQASSARHAFHQRYFTDLLITVVVAVIVNMVLVFFIRPNVLIGGILLMGLVIVYLFFQRRFHFMKEFFVAVIYVGGILLPSVVVTNKVITTYHLILIADFFLIGLVNLYMFSWFDAERDRRDNLGSFAVKFGLIRTRIMLVTLFLLCFSGVAIQLAYSLYSKEALIILLMSSVLLFIAVKRDFFSRKELYRLCGDAIFFLPALKFIWGD